MHTFAASRGQRRSVKADKGSIERRALRYEARRYYSSASGNAWKVVDLHPATCLYTDGPMRFETRREETNLVVDRADSPGEASARAKTTELFKWNSQNEPAASNWIKIGGVGRTSDTFYESYASFSFFFHLVLNFYCLALSCNVGFLPLVQYSTRNHTQELKFTIKPLHVHANLYLYEYG